MLKLSPISLIMSSALSSIFLLCAADIQNRILQVGNDVAGYPAPTVAMPLFIPSLTNALKINFKNIIFKIFKLYEFY